MIGWVFALYLLLFALLVLAGKLPDAKDSTTRVGPAQYLVRMVTSIKCIMMTGLLTGAASAEQPGFSLEPVEACLAKNVRLEDRMTCIGLSSRQCIDAPGGGGGYAEALCHDAELAFWDDLLNETYQQNLASAADDPALVTALRDLQRAWIPYRDARCDAVFKAWGEGTGRSPAFVECLMRTTAAQALFLGRCL